MNADEARAVVRSGGSGEVPSQVSDRVRALSVSPALRALSALPRIEYADAFAVEIGAAAGRTGEEWARAFFEDRHIATRRTLRLAWDALGLKLGSTEDARLVLGWPIARSTSDFALLAASSRLGFSAEVLVKREGQTLISGTFFDLRSPLSRVVWAGASPGHRLVQARVLEQTGRQIRAQG